MSDEDTQEAIEGLEKALARLGLECSVFAEENPNFPERLDIVCHDTTAFGLACELRQVIAAKLAWDAIHSDE